METDPARHLLYAVASIAKAVDLAHEDTSRRLDRIVEHILELAHEIQMVPTLTTDRIEHSLDRSTRQAERVSISTPPFGTGVPTALLDNASAKMIAAHVTEGMTAQIQKPVESDGIRITISQRLTSSLALKLFLAAGGGMVLTKLVELLCR